MNKKIKEITVIGVFAAVGFALMMAADLVPKLPFVPSFLTLDISDLPALLATFMFGPFAGVAVCLIKNIIHLPFSSTMMVGELSNFIIGSALCLVSGYIYRFKRTRAGAMIAMACGSVFAGVACFFTNLFLIYPLFYAFVVPKEVILSMCRAILPWISSIEQSLLVFNVPFTTAKCFICSIVTFFVYKKLKKALRLD